MPTNKEIREKNALLREQNRLMREGRIISEETLDDSRDFVNVIRDQSKEIKFQVSEKNQLRSIGNSINKIAQESYAMSHQELTDLKASKNILEFQKKIKKDILGLESLKGKIILEDKRAQSEINRSIKEQIVSAKKLSDQLIEQKEITEEIANNFGVKTLGFIEDITKAVPGLRKFSKPFEDASKAARMSKLDHLDTNKSIRKLTDYNLKTGSGLTKQRLKQLNLTEITGKTAGADAAKLLRDYSKSNSSIVAMKAGFKSLGPAVSAALGPLALIQLAVKALKFIGDLFIAADANTTAIAKNLGISKDSARAMREQLQIVAGTSSNILVNTKALVEAQGQLTQAVSATVIGSEKLAENQVFLTKNLGIAGDKAADMQIMFNATGQSLNSVIDGTIEFANRQAKANGFLISGQEILREISNTSAEVAGYYGFNNKALARAVVLSRQYGLTLMQTQSISKGLLEFESSIANELEAEILTGKELNFEKARYLALTGDSAGAAAAVLKQAQELTTEQRKNPILMQSMAKAAGLSVEELNKAFLVEEKLNMSRKEYNDLLDKGNRLGKQELVERLGLQGASREEIEKTLTAQEKFAAALEKAKDSFAMLVNDGYLDMLVDAIVSLANGVGNLTGASAKRAASQATALQDRGKISSQQASFLTEAAAGPGFLDYATLGINPVGFAMKNAKAKAARATLNKMSNTIDDGVINPEGGLVVSGPKGSISLNKDDSIIAGTNLGGNSGNSELLREIKSLRMAVERGGNVYLDNIKVGTAMVVGSSKLA